MKYMGSKARIAKHILPIILKDRKEGQWYVEPFVGGANMIDKVEGNRIGGEINEYISSMWSSLVCGWTPRIICKDEYKEIRDNKGRYPHDLVGWVGIACSYSGKWFGGFAGSVSTKGGVRDYQAEAHKNLKAQIHNLLDVKFVHGSYDSISIPDNSIIYCDPPYEGTTGYKDKFDHSSFWQWCRDKTLEGHTVFISEYNAPDDFECIWAQEVKSSLSANGKSGSNKVSVEKLFVYKPKV